MFTAAFDGAKQPAAAIRAAIECEENDVLDCDSDSEGSEWEGIKDVAATRYKHALRRLQRAFPGEHCDWTEDGVCENIAERCVCGVPDAGQAAWPWVLQRPAFFYCCCEFERGVANKQAERDMWVVAVGHRAQGEAREDGEERDIDRFAAFCNQI